MANCFSSKMPGALLAVEKKGGRSSAILCDVTSCSYQTFFMYDQKESTKGKRTCVIWTTKVWYFHLLFLRDKNFTTPRHSQFRHCTMLYVYVSFSKKKAYVHRIACWLFFALCWIVAIFTKLFCDVYEGWRKREKSEIPGQNYN